MLNKFKPRYKTTKKIVDWEPTPDSKSRTRDRDKAKAGQGGDLWVKAYSDGHETASGSQENPHHSSKPLDIATNESGDTFHLFRQFKDRTHEQVSNLEMINTAADFCITKVNASGKKEWEKIYGFSTHMEDGAGIYLSPSHDGSTPDTWENIFTYKLPEFFSSSEYEYERFKPHHLLYADDYLYVCSQVLPEYYRPNTPTPDQQLYPNDKVQGIYVIKVDANTGEVVDDSYTHIKNEWTGDNFYRGLEFINWNYSMPIFNYDKYQNKIIAIVKLSNKYTVGGNQTRQRSSWGDAIFEIDVETMTSTKAKYLNYQAERYTIGCQTKHMIAFSPTHNYLVCRSLIPNHSERVYGSSSSLEGYPIEGKEDHAIVKFDKNWNMVDRKQYGYQERDDEGNYFDFNDPSEGFGTELTQAKSKNTQVFHLFYSESKDKLYARSRAGYNEAARVLEKGAHGQYFIDNVSEGLDYSVQSEFRITEIEPSDLSVVSVKWPEWNGPGADNQYPGKDVSGFYWYVDIETYGAPASMSPDGKYIYSLIHYGWGISVGSYYDNIWKGQDQKHSMYTKYISYYGGETARSSNILRYNIEEGRFDRSWTVVAMQYERDTGIDNSSYWTRYVNWPQQIVATRDGWSANWAHGNGDSRGRDPDEVYLDSAVVVGATNADSKETKIHLGVEDRNLDPRFLDNNGAMICQNGDVVSTWTEPPGYMTANENWMWDETPGYEIDKGNEYNEGRRFYTYYSSRETLSEKEAFFNQNVFLGHKVADVIGDSHKAYDQDGFVEKVIEVTRTSTSPDLYVATSYDKNFYTGSDFSEGDILGGDGGLVDEMGGTKPYAVWVQGDVNVDVTNKFSDSGLLPPLPETDHHVFYSIKPDLHWDDLPTADPNNFSLQLVDTTTSGWIAYRQEWENKDPISYNPVTVYRYKAIFDWDNTFSRGEDPEICSIERFGLNSATGKRNQISNGVGAFKDLRSNAKDLMHYHGETLLLQWEENKWDFWGPGFRTLDTSNLTDMSQMFAMPRLQSVGVSSPTLSTWDTSNVTNMSYMFDSPYSAMWYFELRWDTSSVTNMEQMFGGVAFVDARTWDFSNVVNMDTFCAQGSLIIIDRNITPPSWPQGVGRYECRDLNSYLQRVWPGLTDYSIVGHEDCVNWEPYQYTVMVANREITDSDLPMYGSANIPSDTQLELIDQYETLTRSPRYIYKATFPWNNATNDALRQSVSLDWLVDVLQFGAHKIEDGRNAFNYAPITKISAFLNPRFSVSNITNFDNMFLECFAFNQNLANWDTSNAVSMSSMFSGCDMFNGDIASWDVSNVQYMDSMFSGCSNFNQDISGWNTQNVISADNQFNQASSFNQDLSAWCVSLLASEPADFATGATSWTEGHPVWGTCPRNEDGSAPDEFYHTFVANANAVYFPVPSDDEVGYCFVDGVQKDYITEIKGNVFDGSTIKAAFDWDNYDQTYNTSEVSLKWIQDLVRIGYNTETGSYNQIKNSKHAFYDMENVVQSDAIANLDISNLTNLDSMFEYCNDFNTDISGWDTSNITSMESTFKSCYRFNQPIGSWNVSNVTSMPFLFYGAYDFAQDISSWDVSSVTDMYSMFYNADSFNQDISPWNTQNVTNMTQMFYSANIFNQDLSQWCVPLLTSSPYSFDRNAAAWTLPRPVWGTCPRGEDPVNQFPADEWHIFVANGNSVQLPCADEDVVAVVIDNTSKDYVSEIKGNVFDGLTIRARFDWDNSVAQSPLDWVGELVQIGINGQTGSTPQIKSGDYAFYQMSNIVSSDIISNLDVSNLTSMSNMFANATLFNSDISQWVTSNVTNMSNMFKNASNFNSNISKGSDSQWDTGLVTNMDGMFSGAASFNQNLSEWCVSLIPSEPTDFATGATSWVLEKPVWGTCPTPLILTTFVSKLSTMSAGQMPANTSGFSVTKISDNPDGTYTYEADFEWENTYARTTSWLVDVLKFKNNKLVRGYKAFLDAEMEQITHLKEGMELVIEDGNLYETFRNTKGALDGIQNLDVSNVTNMYRTFFQHDSNGATLDLSTWDTSNVAELDGTFNLQVGTVVGLENWDTSSVTDFAQFARYSSGGFNPNISGWDTSAATTMYEMFRNAADFNQDLSAWCVSQFSSEPYKFDDSTPSWTLPRPVWGTCPTLYTEFVTNTPTLTWDMLPTNDADNGSISLLSDNGDGTWTFEVDASYDNSIVQKSLTWLVDVVAIKDTASPFVESYAFNGSPATSITALESDYVAGEDLSYMFANMPNFNQDISGWDVSATTNMDGMFSGATSFNQNLSNYCVYFIATKPTDFDTGATAFLEENNPVWGCCGACGSGPTPTTFTANSPFLNWDMLPTEDADNGTLQLLSADDVNSVYEYGADFIWNNSIKAINLTYLLNCKTIKGNQFGQAIVDGIDVTGKNSFRYAYEATRHDVMDIIDFSNVKSMNGMFIRNYLFNQDLSGLDTSTVNNTISTFYECQQFNSDISTWNMSNVTVTASMFVGTLAFQQDISGWDVSNVKDMAFMFNRSTFNQDISGWDVSSVDSMDYMFMYNDAFNQDISGWDVSNVFDFDYMFYSAAAFNQPIGAWNTSSATQMVRMFDYTESFNQDLSEWCVPLIASAPTGFDTNATAWTLPDSRPVWGTCPRGEDGL